jgi:hypothetical protein
MVSVPTAGATYESRNVAAISFSCAASEGNPKSPARGEARQETNVAPQENVLESTCCAASTGHRQSIVVGGGVKSNAARSRIDQAF